MIRLPGLVALFGLVFLPVLAPALSVSNYAVQVTATVQTAPPTITLYWVPDAPQYGYSLYRKLLDDVNWGSPTSLPANAANYVDTNVAVGDVYEYAIYKDFTNVIGDGYICAGIEAPLTDDRGKIILAVDSTFAADLNLELARLQHDLAGDGWTVVRHDVSRTAVDPGNTNSSVWAARSAEIAALKSIINSEYNADPEQLKAVFLLGHLPVPYSGDLKVDEHADHEGAWPADVYYASTNGVWTDATVSNTTAADPRNWNVPGDGKLDQTLLTSVVGLQIGRVDFADLPAFPQSERELLRQYLNKNHKFRHARTPVQRAGLIDDNLGIYDTREAAAVNGWRNFSPFFGPANIVAGDWLTASPSTYLWAYGCGTGTWTSASGVASTWNLVTNDTPFVFTMLYGSYFGDWDSQNNLLRAQLATAGYSLACTWAGRPYWYFHHMALGETLGFSTRLCQNGAYGSSRGLYEPHVALMGDPTLRMHPVSPPSKLVAGTNLAGATVLNWAASSDPSVAGYHIYRASNATGPFTRLTSALVTGTAYTDPSVFTNIYMVRAVKLEQTPSGTYSNASQGIFQSLNGKAGAPWVKLLEPTNNASFGVSPSIKLSASLFDPSAGVTNIAFFANGNQVGSSTGPAYAFTWTNVPGGTWSLTARALTVSGLQTNSAPVTITVAGLAAAPQLTNPPLHNGTNVKLTFSGTVGIAYSVQRVPGLGATWTNIGTTAIPSGGTATFTDNAPLPNSAFYRVVYP